MGIKKMALATSALALAVMLAGCGGASMTQGVTKAEKNHKGGFMGLKKLAQVEVQTPAAFKAKKKIALANFTVGFDIEKADSQKAGGGLMGNGFGGKSSAYSKLVGVDNVTMSVITEAAYADFTKKLKAAGYDVVGPQDVLANEAFSGTKTYDNPLVATSGGFMTAKNETRYFTPGVFGKNRSFMGSIPGETGGFAFSNPASAATKYVAATGVPVVYVTYKLTFANASGHGGWASSSSSVQVGQGLTMQAGVSRLGIIGGEGGTFSTALGSMSLGQPLSSDKAFATVEDSTTGVNKGVQVATNVIGLIGGVGTNSTRNYTFNARPADYKAAAMDVVTQTNDSFIAKMTSLR